MTLETFSRNAADLIRLRRALYGADDAQTLMLRCFRCSRSGRINEATVLRQWQAMDDAHNAALDNAATC